MFQLTLAKTWIKICGITRTEDANQAMALGANALGTVVYGPSPRAVQTQQIPEIFQNVRSEIVRVALFVNPDVSLVEEVLATKAIDCLQFHGDEPAAFCSGFGMPYMKAIRIRSTEQALQEMAAHPEAERYLLDKFVPNVPGGTGETMDWSIAAEIVAAAMHPVVLAGGLNSDNVVTAIQAVHPQGVDVSSGVELSHGVKCPQKMQSFIEGVHSV